jgi:hypothetical protein
VMVSSKPPMGQTWGEWLWRAMMRPPGLLGYYRMPTLQLQAVIYSNHIRASQSEAGKRTFSKGELTWRHN